MPNVRHGEMSKNKQARQVIATADVAGIVTAAQAAKSVPDLRQAVGDLAEVVLALAEAVGVREVSA